jgi:hypothetical protein
MSHTDLFEFVKAAAEKFSIRGVAVAVWANGTEAFACKGVTSVENLRPWRQTSAGLRGLHSSPTCCGSSLLLWQALTCNREFCTEE